ncbi:hypothetical protein SDC9_93202 [bioreactor metagenome]|uniref:Uncharacterized protein n=1 Tax=bioreactor metagenome TaxID=1076179 RepID=A0A644ZZU9_9ZZZZ
MGEAALLHQPRRSDVTQEERLQRENPAGGEAQPLDQRQRGVNREKNLAQQFVVPFARLVRRLRIQAGAAVEDGIDKRQRQRGHGYRRAAAVVTRSHPAVADLEQPDGQPEAVLFAVIAEPRQKMPDESVIAECLHDISGVGRLHDLFQLQRQARDRRQLDQRQGAAQIAFGLALQPEAILSDQFQRPQHPDRIFFEPQPGIADGTDQPGFNVGDAAAGIIKQLLRHRIVEERVHREVPPPGVFLGGAEVIVVENHIFRLFKLRDFARAGGQRLLLGA